MKEFMKRDDFLESEAGKTLLKYFEYMYNNFPDELSYQFSNFPLKYKIYKFLGFSDEFVKKDFENNSETKNNNIFWNNCKCFLKYFENLADSYIKNYDSYSDNFLIKLFPIIGKLKVPLISIKISQIVLDIALKELSKHTFSSDIGSNKNEDPDSKYIDGIYDFIKRSEDIVMNLQFYKLGKNVNFPRENGKNVKYKCKYGDVIIQKIDNGKVEKVDIRKLY